MSITTIELRERDQSSNTDGLNNGDFEIQLEHPITVKEGETIGVSRVFLDTATDNRIHIDEDVETTISFIPYFQNFNESKDSQTLRNYYTQNPVRQPDGQTYYPSWYSSTDTGLSLIKSITFFPAGQTGRFMFIGDPTFYFQYKDANGTLQIFKSHHSKHLKDPFRNTGDKNDVNIIFQTAFGFQPIPSGSDSLIREYEKANIDLNRLNEEVVDITGGQFRPIFFRHNITIPKSKGDGYTPNQLSRIITDNLSSFSTDEYFNTNAVTTNFLLTTTNNISVFGIEYAPSGSDGTVFYCSSYHNTDATGKLEATANPRWSVAKNNGSSPKNLFVGASQMALEFDDNSQDSDGTARFKWSATYTPHIIQSNIVNRLFAITGGQDGFVSNKMGGVVFTDLEPASFWFDTLKFNPNILVNITHTPITGNVYPLSHGDGTYASGGAHPIKDPNVFSINARDGITSTGSFIGADALVDKTTDAGQKAEVPALAGDSDNHILDSQTTTSIPIYSNEAIVEGVADTGYYLIEINAISNNDYVYSSQKTNGTKKIGAICSRYYTSQSYTSGGLETSLSWTNQGTDMIIKSFKVRVLNPDGSPVELGLGDDNTVFLSHTHLDAVGK